MLNAYTRAYTPRKWLLTIDSQKITIQSILFQPTRSESIKTKIIRYGHLSRKLESLFFKFNSHKIKYFYPIKILCHRVWDPLSAVINYLLRSISLGNCFKINKTLKLFTYLPCPAKPPFDQFNKCYFYFCEKFLYGFFVRQFRY